MVLNLVSLGVFAAAFAAAVLILRRRLPRPGTATALVCVRCGAPAAAMTTFTCPGCGQDVRGMGLAPARGRSPTGPFWAAATFTTVLFLLMLLASGIVMSAVPRARHFHQTLSMHGGRDSLVRVELSVSGRGAQSHVPTDGTLIADLFTRDGGYAELRVDVPERTWELADRTGVGRESGAALDERTALRWAEMAGLDPTDPTVRDAAVEALDEVVRMTGPDPISTYRRGPGSQFSSRGGSASASFTPPPGALASVLIVGCAAWLAGLWVIVARRYGRRDAPPTTVSAPVAGGVQ